MDFLLYRRGVYLGYVGNHGNELIIYYEEKKLII